MDSIEFWNREIPFLRSLSLDLYCLDLQQHAETRVWTSGPLSKSAEITVVL